MLKAAKSGFYDRYLKRCLDLLLALVALPFAALEFLVVAPLVYIQDRGPLFYCSRRVGQGGREFRMYKYRTMRVGAPDIVAADGSTYNAADDPRLTRVGGFLRRTSLDELPQILNVFKGEMSFIGPRPDLPREAALYQGSESLKLLVRPGISGYAQVYGRNELSWRQRLALDADYVRQQSFWLDLRIFLKTFAVVFSQQGVFTASPAQAQNPQPTQPAIFGEKDGPDLTDSAPTSPTPSPPNTVPAPETRAHPANPQPAVFGEKDGPGEGCR